MKLVLFWLLVYQFGVAKMKELINIQTFAEHLYLAHTKIFKQKSIRR